MQLAIKATGEGAKMLSFLLAKNPQNLYDRIEKGHRIRLTYTVFKEREVEAVIFVTPDPVELVKNSPDTYEITQYINDKDDFISPIPIWGSLFYYDEQFCSKDVLILNEVIEHIEESRLPRVMETILGSYKPKVLLITTPNAEYNVVYQMTEKVRHKDHRFEWTRTEFSAWTRALARRYAYAVQSAGIGAEVEGYGHPSQIAIFTRLDGLENE